MRLRGTPGVCCSSGKALPTGDTRHFIAVAGQALWALREGLEAIHSKWLAPGLQCQDDASGVSLDQLLQRDGLL